MSEDLAVDLPFSEILERVAAKTPGPGGGAVAAMAVSLGAALCAMAARYSAGRWIGAEEAAQRADQLRAKAEPLVAADAAAFEAVLSAIHLPRDPEPEERHRAIRSALSAAADVPMAVAEVASEVAALGAALAEKGNPNLIGDSLTAALLAEAAARSAASLVRINLASRREDSRLTRVGELVSRSAFCARRATRLAEGANQW